MQSIHQILLPILALAALVSGQGNALPSLMELNPCSTWYPLGFDGQTHDMLPYSALCTPSADGRQIVMQVASMQPEVPFTGVVATPVQSGNQAFTHGGSFGEVSFGYTIVSCSDGSQSVVKDDFSDDTVFSQIWNLPANVSVADVKCRFMIAKTREMFWNDVIVPAVQPATTAAPAVGAASSGAASSGAAAPAAMAAVTTAAPVNAETSVVTANITMSIVVDNATEVGNVSDSVIGSSATLPTLTQTTTGSLLSSILAEAAPVGQLTVTDFPFTNSSVGNTAEASNTAGTGNAKEPAMVITTTTTEPSTTTGFLEILTKTARPVTTTPGIPLLHEKAIKKTIFDSKTGYWCENSGSIFVLPMAGDGRPETHCRSYYIANYANSMDHVKPLGRFGCAGHTAFSTDACGCLFTSDFTCPNGI